MNTMLLDKLLGKANWEGSAVGTPDCWPAFLQQSFLHIAVNPLPACLLWGADHLLIYNEPFENHPGLSATLSVGQPLTACSEAFWQPIIMGLKQAAVGVPILLENIEAANNASLDVTHFNVSVSPLIEAGEQLAGYMLLFIDTTEKVHWQRKAQTLEENLHTIIRHAPVAMAAFKGKDLIVQLANRKVCEMWGKPYQDCIGRPIFEIMPEVKNQGFEDLVSRVIGGGESIEIKEMPVMKTHNGRIQRRYMTFSYEPLKNEAGEIDGLVTVGIDVTDSIQIKKEFTEAQERTSIAVEAAAVGTFELVLATDEIITSARFNEIFGVPASKRHQTYFEVIHPDDVTEWKETLRVAMQSGKLFQQYRICKSDGNVCWVETLGRVYFDDSGKPERIFGTVIDVTVQSKIKQKLVDEQKHLQMLLNSLPTIAWTNDPAGDVNFYNQRWYDYTGLTFEETKAWGWKEVIHPDDLQYNLDTYASILSGDSSGTFEIREKGVDGVYRWHLVNMQPIKDQSGKVIQWVGTATDIQRLKELEKQKEEFISIASHELKTPLTSVKAFNQIMLRAENSANLKEFVLKSRDHINRLEKLINDLLDVSKISSGKLSYDMQCFDFEKMLIESIESVQMTTKKHQIVFEGCDNILYHGDANRLEQVLNNLLNNAVKYSPNGGLITVTCNMDNNGLVVAVSDQGIGIEKCHLSKLFERYYRIDDTDMRFSGLGLGLFITAEIIKRHNGSLWIESEPGIGSTFFFRLPLSDNDIAAEADEERYYKDKWISISYNQSDNAVVCNWTGHQNIHSIKRCCLRMLKMCVQFGVSKILADNTLVEGTWTDATDWVAKEFYPMMDAAGIRKIAWVHSKSVFSQLAAEKTIEMAIGGINTKFFGLFETAHSWLKND